jgi:hypothetical protein
VSEGVVDANDGSRSAEFFEQFEGGPRALRPCFGLSVSWPLSSPTGSGVIASWKSKCWGRAGVSLKGNASGGTFVARRIDGSQGRATGSFGCRGIDRQEEET